MNSTILSQNPLYVLKNAGVPTLIPYGQLQADYKTPVELNETGVWLWENLKTPLSEQELMKLVFAEFEPSNKKEKDILQRDFGEFIATMVKKGIIFSKENDISYSFSDTTTGRFVSIAGLNVEVLSKEFPKEFESFEIQPPETIHQKIFITYNSPGIKENGKLLIRYRELVVWETKKEYILLFPEVPEIEEVHILKTGKVAVYYMKGKIKNEPIFFSALRIVFLYLAGKNNILGIHGASILYRDKVWIFSAPSGTGKSYHTFLWNQMYNTKIINGDTNLLHYDRKKDVITVPGMPWCGGSGISSSDTYPLGGIILMKQARHNQVWEIKDNKQLLVFQRLITPAWDLKAFNKNFDLCSRMTDNMFVCGLSCNMEKESVDVIRNRIDCLYVTT